MILIAEVYLTNRYEFDFIGADPLLPAKELFEQALGSAEDLTEIRAEIQLRTIAMDCWASLEHQMKYKKHIEHAELISAELKRCADEMASTDLSMQTIRRMIQTQ